LDSGETRSVALSGRNRRRRPAETRHPQFFLSAPHHETRIERVIPRMIRRDIDPEVNEILLPFVRN
jgi:hypothetical protein